MCRDAICFSQKPIRLTGKVLYTDRRQRIHIKQPLSKLLGGTKKNATYTMEIVLCPQQLAQRVQELRLNRIQPVLLYFQEEETCDALNAETNNSKTMDLRQFVLDADSLRKNKE